LRLKVDQVLQLVGYTVRVLEEAPGEWLLAFIVAAFFLGKHGGQIDNWFMDVARIGLSAILAVFVERAISEFEPIAGPLALTPETPTPALISILVFIAIFLMAFFVVGRIWRV
jgi:hypothetical protein